MCHSAIRRKDSATGTKLAILCAKTAVHFTNKIKCKMSLSNSPASPVVPLSPPVAPVWPVRLQTQYGLKWCFPSPDSFSPVGGTLAYIRRATRKLLLAVAWVALASRLAFTKQNKLCMSTSNTIFLWTLITNVSYCALPRVTTDLITCTDSFLYVCIRYFGIRGAYTSCSATWTELGTLWSETALY